jgi:hypothetical protein
MPDNWSIVANRYRLPYSQRVDIPILLQVFSHTATSYKYLYFQALLHILEETGFNNQVIRLDDILLEMLTLAWYPHTYFKLSFGINDRVAQELDRIAVESSDNLAGRNRLKAKIAKTDFTGNGLLHMVPYRLLAPFFTRKLQGTLETRKNAAIAHLAIHEFDTVRPFYYISSDHRSIVMHPDWMLYLHDNIELVKSFAAWNWLDYMQRRNPSVPNLQMKLFPPLVRVPMGPQRRFWNTVLSKEPLHCIFSGEPLSQDHVSLDHFLPWSFVAHDRLWNLIPVSKAINSSKSNNLPSMEKYFNKFVELQHSALWIYRQKSGSSAWEKAIEPYVADLHMKPTQVLDREQLYKSLRNTMEPLYELATIQGFSPDWEWRKH